MMNPLAELNPELTFNEVHQQNMAERKRKRKSSTNTSISND
jgi:hypothetical protein